MFKRRGDDKGMKQKRKVVLMIALVVVVVALGYGVSAFVKVQKYKEAVRNIQIQEVDLTAVKDGTYIGEYDVDLIRAKVKVDVVNHQITDIQFIDYKHDRGEGAPQVLNDIVEEQRIDVDAVSGATNSSQVIKKAVERALVSD